MKHRPPSAVPLLLDRDGDTTLTTWGEFLDDNRHDRDVVRAVWRVVTGDFPHAIIVGDDKSLVTVRLAEGGAR